MRTLEDKQNQVILIAVGDIMLGELPLCLGHGVGSKIKENGAISPFLQVAPILKKGDIVFGNLEAVLSNNSRDKKCLSSVAMRATPEAVNGLAYAGFNVLSLANNHALEHGDEALTETMSILSAHDIKYVGVDANITRAREPLIIGIKDITIALLAYCLVIDRTAFTTTTNSEEICSDVRKAKANSNIVVVSLHWGNEYIRRPSPQQISLAHQIIDSGADVILGHHPHVLQGIEKYHNGLVAYSLGNFVFDMTYLTETRSSIMVEFRLSKKGVAGYRMIPIYISDEYAPYILSGKQKELALGELDKLSAYLVEDGSANYGGKEGEYIKQVDCLRNQASRRMMRYFARNLYRYPPRFAFQIITNYLRKHLR